MRSHRLFLLHLAAAVGLSGCADTSDVTTAPNANIPSYSRAHAESGGITGRHLVVFKQEKIPAKFAATVTKLGGRVELSLEQVGAATVSGLDAKAISALRKIRGVSMVEPEVLLSLPKPAVAPAKLAADVLPSSPADPTTAAFFGLQWNMHAINADDAWAAGHLGSPGVTVAILDTGLGYTHVDLQGRVDLSRSASFVPGDDELVQQFFPGAHPVLDLHYHGTHVGATVSSNAFMTAGVTSRVTLIGIKVCGYIFWNDAENPELKFEVRCPTGSVLAGMLYAIENGADVANLSLGGLFQKKTAPGFISILHRVFNFAHQNNVTVVVAAGNESSDLDHELVPLPDEEGNIRVVHAPSLYEAYCNTPNNICVSATGPTASGGIFGPWDNVDAIAGYTNFGRSAINVAAPGGTGAGAVWAACSPTSLVPGLAAYCRNFPLGLGGTSMASPHVAGLAALLVDEVGNKPSQIRAAIQQSADDLGQPGTDPFYGKGRINVASALGQ